MTCATRWSCTVSSNGTARVSIRKTGCPFLVTYPGHKDVHYTLIYITVTQDLLHLANERFRAVGAPCLLDLGQEVRP